MEFNAPISGEIVYFEVCWRSCMRLSFFLVANKQGSSQPVATIVAIFIQWE